MGLLVEVVHGERAASVDEAAALFQALGIDRVAVSARPRPDDDAALARLIDAVDPERDAMITFEHGRLGPAAWDALDALARSGAGYLDVAVGAISLRVWREESWVTAGGVRPGAVETIARIVASMVGDDATVTWERVSPTAAAESSLQVRTPRAASAAGLFRALADPDGELSRGHVTAPDRAALAILPGLLRDLGGTAAFSLELGPAAAAGLARALPALISGWQGDNTAVRLSDGEISTYLVAPLPSEEEAAWRAQIRDALARVRSPG
jgi:hypothetical protein